MPAIIFASDLDVWVSCDESVAYLLKCCYGAIHQLLPNVAACDLVVGVIYTLVKAQHHHPVL